MTFGAENRRKLPVFVDEEEYTLLLEHTVQMHHKVAFMLARESGLRVSEIIALRPEHIDVKNKKILIIDGKGGRDRVVPLPYNWQPHHFKYIPVPCGKRSLQFAFTMYAKQSGIIDRKPGVHFHSLRHGFATQCWESGIQIPEIQMLLGHSDIGTTMIYTHVSPYKALDAYRKKF